MPILTYNNSIEDFLFIRIITPTSQPDYDESNSAGPVSANEQSDEQNESCIPKVCLGNPRHGFSKETESTYRDLNLSADDESDKSNECHGTEPESVSINESVS